MNKPNITTVNILGTNYTITFNEELINADGLCDKTSKEIKICSTLYEEGKEGSVKYLQLYANKVLRHEVLHAFRNESGLLESAVQDEEQWIDWIAYQFHKIVAVFEELQI